MEKPTKFIFTIMLILISSFLLLQVVGLNGKQSLGWSSSYIDIYSKLFLVAIGLTVIFGILVESAGKISDHPLLDIISIFDFDDNQDFRLFSGDGTSIAWGLIAGLVFLMFIGGSVVFLGAVWQPTPSPLELESSIKSPLSAGHDDALAQMGISNYEEAWFIAAQPSVSEDLVFNYFLPSIIVALLFIVPYLFGMELNKGTFLILSSIACLISSGLAGGWQTGFIPTFSGSHSDVYTNVPSFYAAAGFSFIASMLNLAVGYPISIPSHFANNWFLSFSLMITLAVGSVAIKSSLLFAFFKKIKKGVSK